MSRRNLEAILALSDEWLKMAVLLTKDAATLAGFQQAFPELFLPGDEKNEFTVPTHDLRKLSKVLEQEIRSRTIEDVLTNLGG